MTTFLAYGDSLLNPEMRHEIAEAVHDPVIFLDHDGRRVVVGGWLDHAVLERRADAIDEFWSYETFGSSEIESDPSFPLHLIDAELTNRVLSKAGVSSAVVPGSFPVLLADYLRDKGVEVRVGVEEWAMRRRRKSSWELEGIERAQRAAETAMLTAAHMLREAEPTPSGELRFEGEPLTAGLVREAMTAELSTQGAESDEIIVQSGDAVFAGHELGSGPVLADKSCVIDCFPRDRHTGAYSDMTRTFVPGRAPAELKEIHGHCLRALEIAFAAIKPGADGAFRAVCEYFESHGYETKLSHPGHPEEGFTHSLGHGVGLEVHERPWMGRRSDAFVEGDVVAVEPGLYVKGVGGVRLEDTVVVTGDGIAHLTEPYPYDLEP